MYLCPLCQQDLVPDLSGKSYVCPNRHRFDRAKEGYLNLLPVQHKHSKEPGDNKLMMQARRGFLEAGFYAPMAEAVAQLITAHTKDQVQLTLLDLGCGEGYYTRQLAKRFNPGQMILHGVDIGKAAIAMAAKKLPPAQYAVASVNRLPYPEQSFDLVLRVFAPSNEDELRRVLKPTGLLLTVTPGPRHLWQLKQMIYPEVREHALEAALPEGFERLESQRLCFEINPDSEQRLALLHMTPFAWRANEVKQQAIKALAELVIETDFILTLAVRQAD